MAKRTPVVIGDDRPDLDPAVAEQLTMRTVATGQQNAQLNSAVGRQHAASPAAVLTLGVMQNQAASKRQLTELSPQEAAAAAQLRGSQDPSHMAGLNTSVGTPGSGAIQQ